MKFIPLIALTCAAAAAFAADPPIPLGPNADLGGRLLPPPSSEWNRDISRDPADPNSATLIASIGAAKPLHIDFGTVWKGAPNGIPYVVVDSRTPRVPVTFQYNDESDPGPYPIPPDAPIEGGPKREGDRHILMLERDTMKLYELFHAFPPDGGKGWHAGSGAIFDLRTGKSRPAGWTSADAAGLPILPGLARYDEIAIHKELRHALRFTVQKTRRAYVPPATHFASRSDDPKLPPMGMRVRLRADFNTVGFGPNARVILDGMKKFGLILADNGNDWFVCGAPDPRWNDDELQSLRKVKGGDFEVVKMGPMTTR